MKKNIFLLAIFFFFVGTTSAQQKTSIFADTTAVILKMSVGALAEYATCLHFSTEIRPLKRFSLQADLGYYSDFLRNPNYNAATSKFEGVRLGGEARYYFTKIDSANEGFLGVSYIANISNAREQSYGVHLEDGLIKDTKTTVGFEHERVFVNAFFGSRHKIKNRLLLEFALGGGFVQRKVSNFEQFDNQVLLTPLPPRFQVIFPATTLWNKPSYIDGYIYPDIAANIKICYRLF